MFCHVQEKQTFLFIYLFCFQTNTSYKNIINLSKTKCYVLCNFQRKWYLLIRGKKYCVVILENIKVK